MSLCLVVLPKLTCSCRYELLVVHSSGGRDDVSLVLPISDLLRRLHSLTPYFFASVARYLDCWSCEPVRDKGAIARSLFRREHRGRLSVALDRVTAVCSCSAF